MRKLLLIAIIVSLGFAACGGDNPVGSERLKDFKDEGGKGSRLGERIPEPSNQPSVLGVGGRSPTAQPSTAPKADEKIFDVTLVDNSPYYEPGASLKVPVGFTIKVTNKDTTEGRPVRSFEAVDGSFSSGPLKPGQVWTQKFDSPGFWKIKDMAAGFILADLEVS